MWGEVCDALPTPLLDRVLDAMGAPQYEVSLTAVQADPDANIDVPGCKLAGGNHVEVR